MHTYIIIKLPLEVNAHGYGPEPLRIGKGYNANVNHANHRFHLSSTTKSMFCVTVHQTMCPLYLDTGDPA